MASLGVAWPGEAGQGKARNFPSRRMTLSASRFQITIKGATPLLMHNGQLANPLNKYAVAMQAVTKTRGGDKLEKQAQLADLEWRGGLYLDSDDKPAIPAMMVKAAVHEGARLSRGGRSVERGVEVMPGMIRLEYPGPGTLDELKRSPSHRDQRLVKVQRARVVRTRPRFDEWGLAFTVAHLAEAVDRENLLRYIADAGLYCGIGDGRGKLGFGRFEITHVDGRRV